jgi:hypothetical protein
LQLSATTNECNTIVLEWGVLGDWDSDTYAIYKSKTIDPEQAFFVGYTDFTTFIDSEVLPFQTYYYWVSGYSTDGCEITDDASGQSIECLDCSGDINGDTFVDMNDLLLLLDDWGACP